MNRPIPCAKCQHLIKDNVHMRCKAFKTTIPSRILGGTFKHTKKYPGQANNILYKEA